MQNHPQGYFPVSQQHQAPTCQPFPEQPPSFQTHDQMHNLRQGYPPVPQQHQAAQYQVYGCPYNQNGQPAQPLYYQYNHLGQAPTCQPFPAQPPSLQTHDQRYIMNHGPQMQHFFKHEHHRPAPYSIPRPRQPLPISNPNTGEPIIMGYANHWNESSMPYLGSRQSRSEHSPGYSQNETQVPQLDLYGSYEQAAIGATQQANNDEGPDRQLQENVNSQPNAEDHVNPDIGVKTKEEPPKRSVLYGQKQNYNEVFTNLLEDYSRYPSKTEAWLYVNRTSQASCIGKRGTEGQRAEPPPEPTNESNFMEEHAAATGKRGRGRPAHEKKDENIELAKASIARVQQFNNKRDKMSALQAIEADAVELLSKALNDQKDTSVQEGKGLKPIVKLPRNFIPGEVDLKWLLLPQNGWHLKAFLKERISQLKIIETRLNDANKGVESRERQKADRADIELNYFIALEEFKGEFSKTLTLLDTPEQLPEGFVIALTTLKDADTVQKVRLIIILSWQMEFSEVDAFDPEKKYEPITTEQVKLLNPDWETKYSRKGQINKVAFDLRKKMEKDFCTNRHVAVSAFHERLKTILGRLPEENLDPPPVASAVAHMAPDALPLPPIDSFLNSDEVDVDLSLDDPLGNHNVPTDEDLYRWNDVIYL